jgi:lipopolysaccharide transport system ATP-binding protein
VVDEVLAVGDAEFQKKAIGKMQDVSKGQGRTVLFVSHNMAAVRSLCTRGILLNNGTIDFTGSIPATLDKYLKNEENVRKDKILHNIKWIKNTIKIFKCEINNTEEAYSVIKSDQNKLKVRIDGETSEDLTFDLMVTFKNKDGLPFATYAKGHYLGEIQHVNKGRFTISKEIELPTVLSKGLLNIDLYLHHPMVEFLLKAPDCCVLETEGYQKGYGRPINQETGGFIGLLDSHTNF